MKASEAFKQGYKEKKDEIYRNILAQAGAYSAQPSQVNKEIADKIKEDNKMDKIKVKRGATGFAAIAACALVAVGLGYTAGIFDDDSFTDDVKSAAPSAEQDANEILTDMPDYDFDTLAEQAHAIVECKISDKYIMIYDKEGNVVQDEDIQNFEDISENYDVFTVYDAEITYVYKCDDYKVGDGISFRQYGGTVEDVTYDYGASELPEDKELLVLLADNGYSLADLKHSAYEYNEITRQFELYGESTEANTEWNDCATNWAINSFIGKDADVAEEWYKSKCYNVILRAMFDDKYPKGTVCKLENSKDGNITISISAGSVDDASLGCVIGD